MLIVRDADGRRGLLRSLRPHDGRLWVRWAWELEWSPADEGDLLMERQAPHRVVDYRTRCPFETLGLGIAPKE